jgi:hypothetical protein
MGNSKICWRRVYTIHQEGIISITAADIEPNLSWSSSAWEFCAEALQEAAFPARRRTSNIQYSSGTGATQTRRLACTEEYIHPPSRCSAYSCSCSVALGKVSVSAANLLYKCTVSRYTRCIMANKHPVCQRTASICSASTCHIQFSCLRKRKNSASLVAAVAITILNAQSSDYRNSTYNIVLSNYFTLHQVSNGHIVSNPTGCTISKSEL